jgi:hypothetical protein
MSREVVDGDLTVHPFEQVLEHSVGQVKVQGVRVVEVVVLSIIVIFLRETLVKGVQSDVGAVQTYTFYDTRKLSVREKQVNIEVKLFFKRYLQRLVLPEAVPPVTPMNKGLTKDSDGCFYMELSLSIIFTN